MHDEDVATEELEKEELSERQQLQAKLKEAIRVSVEEIGTLRKKLTVTVPKTAIDERRSEQFTELKRDAVIPGFRRGRAPIPLRHRSPAWADGLD